jgi:hypothetical protein
MTVLVVVPGCLALGWWQLNRALAGNTLSWAYVFEWPFFAGYAVYMWWRLVHEQPALPRIGTSKAAPGQGESGEDATSSEQAPATTATTVEDETKEDAELAAYNRYLAALNAADQRKQL